MTVPEIEFRRLTLEDGEKFSAFLGLCFGEGFFSRPELYKHWHFDNPAGESIIYGAWDRDKLVGTNAIQKSIFRIREKKTSMAHSFSLATHPEYRLHLFKNEGKIETIFTRINSLCREAIRREGIEMTYGFPNEKAIVPAVKFSGNEKIGTLDLFVDVFRLPEILAMKRPRFSPAFCRLATWIPQLAVSARSVLRSKPKGNFHVSKVETVDEKWDRFAEEIAAHYPVIQDRNAAFLRWRFLDFPVLDYRLLEARKNGKLCGYLVYTVYPWPEREEYRLLAGYVVDFLVLPDQDGEMALHHLLDRARREFIAAGAVMATSIHHVPTTLTGAFLKTGFFVAPKRIAPRSIHFVQRWETDNHSADAANWNNWFLNLADTDII